MYSLNFDYTGDEPLQLGLPPIIADGQWTQNFCDHTVLTSVYLCKPWRQFVFPALWHNTAAICFRGVWQVKVEYFAEVVILS